MSDVPTTTVPESTSADLEAHSAEKQDEEDESTPHMSVWMTIILLATVTVV